MLKHICDHCGSEKIIEAATTDKLCDNCIAEYTARVEATDRRHDKALERIENEYYPKEMAAHEHDMVDGYIMTERGRRTLIKLCNNGCDERIEEKL